MANWRKVGRALCLATATIGCTVAASADSALLLDNFNERVTKEVPVSGRLLVGVALVGNAHGTEALSPRLLWPGKPFDSRDQGLCVTYASRDGQYFGEGEIPASKLQSLKGSARIQGSHGPEAIKYLKGLTDINRDLAILAVRGDCRIGSNATNTTQIQVLDRRESPSGGGVLKVALNSLGLTVTVDALVEGQRQTVNCEKLEGAQRNKAFNMTCDLAVATNATEAQLIVQRRRYERGFPDLVYRLSWAKP